MYNISKFASFDKFSAFQVDMKFVRRIFKPIQNTVGCSNEICIGIIKETNTQMSETYICENMGRVFKPFYLCLKSFMYLKIDITM